MPLLRYKTGDIAIRSSEPCSCGRTTFRISPLLGRKNHMIKLKGTTCYPQGIINVIQSFTEVNDFLIEVSKNDLDTDDLRVYVSIAENAPVETVLSQLKTSFKNSLRVIPEIVTISIPQIHALQEKGVSRKLKRVIDTR